MKLHHLAAIPFALACAAAVAQVAGNGQVQCSGEAAVLSVSASASAADTGRPGAWFIAAHHPSDATQVVFLTPGGWVVPESVGKLVPYGVYYDGIPGSIGATACAPMSSYSDGGSVTYDFSGCGPTTDPWAGYIVKVGYGVLTPEGEMLVSTRRERMEAAKPIMQQQGRWRPEYEDDEHMREALVIKSMRDGRIVDVLTVPSMQCAMGGA
jgi:hypothetical protein